MSTCKLTWRGTGSLEIPQVLDMSGRPLFFQAPGSSVVVPAGVVQHPHVQRYGKLQQFDVQVLDGPLAPVVVQSTITVTPTVVTVPETSTVPTMPVLPSTTVTAPVPAVVEAPEVIEVPAVLEVPEIITEPIAAPSDPIADLLTAELTAPPPILEPLPMMPPETVKAPVELPVFEEPLPMTPPVAPPPPPAHAFTSAYKSKRKSDRNK
jgi:hypothetical protein